jgi:hypothetical protein
VDYLPARRIELRLVSNDDDLRSYRFGQNMTFGTTAARPSSRRVSRSVRGKLALA